MKLYSWTESLDWSPQPLSREAGVQETRFAFAAEYWGEGAVVCLAREDSPGPIVDQQFGMFETWTHANAFANSLNEGLQISLEDAQQIVISAQLARAELLGEWEADPVVEPKLVEAEALRRGTTVLISQLAAAMMCCQAAKMFRLQQRRDRMTKMAHEVLDRVEKMVYRFKLDPADAKLIMRRQTEIHTELRALDEANARGKFIGAAGARH